MQHLNLPAEEFALCGDPAVASQTASRLQAAIQHGGGDGFGAEKAGARGYPAG